LERSLISNPPYNLKWKHPPLMGFMYQYSGWQAPPEGNANYSFILAGLAEATDRAVFLLPNSVLSTSDKAEVELKRQLIAENLLLAVIALPANMFESTNIPTCLLVFDKHKDTRKIAMIDLTEKAVEEVRDQRGQFGGTSHTNRTYHKTVNVITNETMQMCVDLINGRQDKDGFCKWISPEELRGYNLAPKRYFDIKTEIAHRSFEDIANDYNRIIKQKNAIKIRMNKTAAARLGFDCMDIKHADLTDSFAVVGQKPIKEDNISFGADDGIRITISTKEGVHPLILDFLNHWKQMIIYLNTEENRLLAEFRDALMPELMSGKIDLSEEHMSEQKTSKLLREEKSEEKRSGFLIYRDPLR